MPYDILPYSFQKAQELGVNIIPSKNPKKKIDIYDYFGKFICSIGDIDFSDYPHYIQKYGIEYANERRRLYHIRHAKEANKVGSCGWWALKLLW